jgi:hypothetical protein
VFFNFRQPAPTIVPLALLLVSYPFGKFLAFTLPITTYRIPMPHLPSSFLPILQPSFAPFRLIVNLLRPLTYPRVVEFSLNPGPWNIKEHVLVFIMANVAVNSPYALNAIVVTQFYYQISLGYWFSTTFVLATQLTGFGLAGLCRRFLVWPASMVWPQNLVACTLLNTLHAEDDDDGIGMYGGTYEPGSKGMSRYRFFIITTVASFLFFFLPGTFCYCTAFMVIILNLFHLSFRLSLRGSVCVLICLLGRSGEYSHQSAFRCSDWAWYEHSHFRLDTNQLDW